MAGEPGPVCTLIFCSINYCGELILNPSNRFGLQLKNGCGGSGGGGVYIVEVCIIVTISHFIHQEIETARILTSFLVH